MWCVMLELYFKVHMYIQLLYIWSYGFVGLLAMVVFNVLVGVGVYCVAVGRHGHLL
jgi:hypothetical protein